MRLIKPIVEIKLISGKICLIMNSTSKFIVMLKVQSSRQSVHSIGKFTHTLFERRMAFSSHCVIQTNFQGHKIISTNVSYHCGTFRLSPLYLQEPTTSAKWSASTLSKNVRGKY